MNPKSNDWFIVPGDLCKSMRELLRWESWRDNEIDAFMQIFSQLGEGEITRLEQFCEALLQKKELKSKHRIMKETYFVGRLFTCLVNDFGDIDYVQKFAQKAKKDIYNMLRERLGEDLNES